jgi:hypothetical protein
VRVPTLDRHNAAVSLVLDQVMFGVGPIFETTG